MIITIPKKLTPVKAVNFSNYIGQIDGYNEDEFVYDFKEMQHCRPFGLLVVASAIRENKRRFPQCKHTIINPQMTQGGKFAAYSGFYKSMGFDVGYSKAETGDRFIPIREITAKELHEQYTNTTVLNDKVNWYSRLLSKTLVGDHPNEVIDAIQYCFREIIRNTFEHGKTNSLWVSGQYWSTRHEAEIAILDEGIGILKSLISNPRITANTCEEANLLALQPGLSRTIGMKQDSFDRWQNSGYGLYVASTICGINGGYFIISSGDSSILVNAEGHKKYSSNQVGTAVCLIIHTNSKKLINFDRTLKMVVKEGEERAKDNGGKRILTASKVTTIASMIRHIDDAIQENEKKSQDCGQIPINTEVQFEAQTVNTHGEIMGIFEYENKTLEGILLNVTGSNRTLYVRNQMKVMCVVRKYRSGKYVLLERHRYQKMQKIDNSNAIRYLSSLNTAVPES